MVLAYEAYVIHYASLSQFWNASLSVEIFCTVCIVTFFSSLRKWREDMLKIYKFSQQFVFSFLSQ